MSEKIEFKFSIDERVKTPFGEEGIIRSLAFDDGGIKYYVKTKQTGSWHKEKELISIS